MNRSQTDPERKMRISLILSVLLVVTLLAGTVACGHKGPPLPPEENAAPESSGL